MRGIWFGIGMLVLAGLVAGGCRQWRAEESAWRTQRAKAGSLIGKTSQEVEAALGRPTSKLPQEKGVVWEYTHVDDRPCALGPEGFDRTAPALERSRVVTETKTMRLYFKDDKLEAISGN
jgi:hypothetical protein